MITNADITIFNKVLGDDRRDVFIPTHIYGVSWYDAHDSSQPTSLSLPEREKYIVRIPISASVSDDKKYIDAALYDELTTQQRAGYWTIQTSCIVAHGIVNVDDGGDGITEDEILSLKTKLFTVNTYADNTIRGTKFTKHWRIGGF